ncbi:MAG TPA: cytidylate kinase-like family protein [Candidatus Limnocylindrales bacterium]|jgi:cytidylate kinase
MPVITISRQFGAAGIAVGNLLADRLDAELLDKAIIAQVAVRSGIPESEIESYDERMPSFWQRVTSALASSSPEPILVDLPYLEQVPSGTMQERLAAVTRAVIEEAAERGNAVIIGRGAAWILGKRPDVLNVQLHASIEARVRYLMARVEEIPPDARPEEKSLRELCQSVDAARGEYVRRLYGVDWLDARSYDLAVDVGRLGIDKSAELIEAAARSLKK